MADRTFLQRHNREQGQRMGNWCLAGCAPITCHCETSPLQWRGNPPVERNQKTITTKDSGSSHFPGTFRYISPLSKGIATPVYALARNDSISLQTPICRAAYESRLSKHGFIRLLSQVGLTILSLYISVRKIKEKVRKTEGKSR